jgi:predicted DNA-binding ribbon-helix-helix protein
MPVQRRGRVERKRSRKMRSAVLKRTVEISGRRTGVSMENAFWDALQDIAVARGTTRAGLITQISKKRRHLNLSSGLRLFVLGYYRRQPRQV